VRPTKKHLLFEGGTELITGIDPSVAQLAIQ
jgi:hypothetical protein